MQQSDYVQPDKKTIRRMNVRLLEKEVGTLTALGKLAGTSQSYLSQCVGKGAFRAIGDDLARRLESATNKPTGWIDDLHVDEPHLVKATAIHEQLLQLPLAKLEAIAILLEIELSDCGAE